MMKSSPKNRIQWKNIRFVPILHNRMEFAAEVRRQFEEFRPDHVAVEYPDTLEGKILQGVSLYLPFARTDRRSGGGNSLSLLSRNPRALH
ncbi:MAG: hypothetical protein JRF21_10835 [Deltaproteobacteria bacterium]|nr:hypothetical protein [Deltaproteobacteria bacterium]